MPTQDEDPGEWQRRFLVWPCEWRGEAFSQGYNHKSFALNGNQTELCLSLPPRVQPCRFPLSLQRVAIIAD